MHSYIDSINKLVPEGFFRHIFEMQRKIGSYFLQTHRRGAHRNFFHVSFLKIDFGSTVEISTLRK